MRDHDNPAQGNGQPPQRADTARLVKGMQRWGASPEAIIAAVRVEEGGATADADPLDFTPRTGDERARYITDCIRKLRRDGKPYKARLARINEGGCDPPYSPTELQELEDLIDGKDIAVLEARCAADITPAPIRWLWPGRIARGKLTVLAGHPDLGKSQVTASMVATVTTAGFWPVDGTKCLRGSVLILSAEDDAADTIVPRLQAAGADLTRVIIVDAVRDRRADGTSIARTFDLGRDIARLRALAKERDDTALIIIDPISAYMGRADSHKNSEVRGLLEPLSKAAADIGAAVVAVTHLTKSGSTEALMRVMGSVAFTATGRAGYLVAADPEDPDRRLFLQTKSNLAKRRDGLAYRVVGVTLPSGIESSYIEWDSESVTMTANEAMAPAQDPAADGESTARSEAEGWLREILKEGVMDGKQLKGLARSSGIAHATLYRAAESIGVKTLPGGFGKPRQWHLCPTPNAGCHVCQPPTHTDRDTHEGSTPLKPSCGAGSAHVYQPQGEDGDSTPLKPSCDAGSAHVCQPPEKDAEKTALGTHGANVGGARVPGVSDLHVYQNQRVVGDTPTSTPEDPTDDGPPSKLSVHYSSETAEHYTPKIILDAAVACMGGIDLDPCSNPGDPNVPARHHFRQPDDGLSRRWRGRVFMNPPYGRAVLCWVSKLRDEYEGRTVTQAIALVPARTDTQWFKVLRDFPVCFIEGRLTFIGNDSPAPFPSAVFYLGDDVRSFMAAFGPLGRIWSSATPTPDDSKRAGESHPHDEPSLKGWKAATPAQIYRACHSDDTPNANWGTPAQRKKASAIEAEIADLRLDAEVDGVDPEVLNEIFTEMRRTSGTPIAATTQL